MTAPHPDERALLVAEVTALDRVWMAKRIRRVLRSSQELFDLDEEVERLTALLLDAAHPSPDPRT